MSRVACNAIIQNRPLSRYIFELLVKNDINGHTCVLYKHESCTDFIPIEPEDIEGSEL